jgi:hypothetical protein
MLFHVRNHWDELGIAESEFSNLFGHSDSENFFSHKNYYSLNGLRIAVVNPDVKPFCPEKKLDVDFILFSGQPKITLAEIREMYDFRVLVIDPSNGFYKVKRWKEEKLANERMHVVSEQGAFVIGS